jgi:hypothetical protein
VTVTRFRIPPPLPFCGISRFSADQILWHDIVTNFSLSSSPVTITVTREKSRDFRVFFVYPPLCDLADFREFLYGVTGWDSVTRYRHEFIIVINHRHTGVWSSVKNGWLHCVTHFYGVFLTSLTKYIERKQEDDTTISMKIGRPKWVLNWKANLKLEGGFKIGRTNDELLLYFTSFSERI